MESKKNSAVHQGKNFKAFMGKTEKNCNKCGFVTFSLHILYSHKYKCQGQLLGKHVFCFYCNRKFNFMNLYRTHKVTCVKKLLIKKNLRTKLKEKHLKYKKIFQQTSPKISFSCPICHASFKSKIDFVSHLKQQNCTQKAVTKSSFSARKSFNKSPKASGQFDKKLLPSTSRQENCQESENKEIYSCNWCKSAYPSEQLFFMHLEMDDRCAMAYYKNQISNTNKKLSSKARKTISVVARKSFLHRKSPEIVFNSKRGFTSRTARKTLTPSRKKRVHQRSVNNSVTSILNQCPVCCENFSDTFTFYQHQKMTNHWGKATKSFTSNCKCPFCGKEFLHLKSRNAHVCNHSDKSENEIKAFLRSCTCNVCSQIFVSELAKLQHIKIKHNRGSNNFKYSSSGSELNVVSDSEFADKFKMSSVPSSVKKKLKQQPNTCPVCSKGFSHTVLRNKHFNEVHLKIFECQFCNTKFKSTSSLSNHIQLNHGKSLDCKNCRLHFNNELELLQHVLKYHPNEAPKLLLPSKSIKDILSRRKSLNIADEIRLKHVEKMNDDSDFQKRNIEYYCDVCNLGYKKLCGLQSHRQSRLHRDTLVKNLDAFQKSLSDLPSSPPPYPRVVKQPEILTCSECSEDFSNIKDFVPHRLSHFSVQSKYLKINELNPYMCEICSDVLDNHSKVQLHLFWHLQIESTATKNTNTGSNKNDTIVPDRLSGQHVAKKSFSKPSNESLQEVVIGGVSKPLFTCKACNVGFTTKAHYNMHIRKLCKKIMPSNQFSKQSSLDIGTHKNSINATETDIVHCRNCNCLFSSETEFEQHNEFCTQCYFDDDSEENANNSDVIKSALNLDSAIAGCITCAVLFDNISGVAVHLSIHQSNENSVSEEITDALHCALCNCLLSLNAFKLHKDFCKTPIKNGSKTTNSKNINVLKSTLELKCAIAACISCELPFEDLETFSKHLMLHQTNQIQNESCGKILYNGDGETSITAINTKNKGSLVNNPTEFLIEDVANDLVSNDQQHLDSSLDFISDYPSNSLLDTENHKSMMFDLKQNDETDNIEDLRENFSQLLCLLISDNELMQKLGYGIQLVDKVLINVLQQMGQEPYTNNYSEINMFRKNIEMLLNLCLKDQILQAIGTEKTTDEIVVEALNIFASENNVLDD